MFWPFEFNNNHTEDSINKKSDSSQMVVNIKISVGVNERNALTVWIFTAVYFLLCVGGDVSKK